MTFEPTPPQPIPLRLRLKRDAANAKGFVVTLRNRALDLIAHAGF